MKSIIGKTLFLLTIGHLFCLIPGTAEAARTFTITQINPAPASSIVMGTTNSITYRVTNTCTGGNSGERLYEVRLRLPGTGTTFSATTAAPAGWTRTAFSTTSVTFRASTWANSIVSGSFLDFTPVLVMRTTTADTNETLRDARASFTLDTNFGNGVTRTGRVTINNPGSWSLKSLLMTLVPSTFSVGTGCTFTLTMTVTNRSTSNITGVFSVPNPPTRTGVSATPGPNPPNINLNAGATGTLVWTYTAGVTAGTLTFTAYARDSTNTRTSPSITTSTITVTSGSSCTFIVSSLAITPACLFSGDTATFTMTVSNTTGAALNNVAPSALTALGTAVIGTFSSPSPASYASIANNGTGTFTWTAPVTGNINDTYYVTGYATANGPIQTSVATSATQDIEGYAISVNPSSTNAGSSNEELVWSITNNGCADLDQISISVPGGWTASSDGYAEVTNTLVSQVDSWTLAGTIFSSPNATDRIPLTRSGDFSLVFSATPTSTGATTFNITVTDSTGMSKTLPSNVTVDPYDTGGLNKPATGVWQEQFR